MSNLMVASEVRQLFADLTKETGQRGAGRRQGGFTRQRVGVWGRWHPHLLAEG